MKKIIFLVLPLIMIVTTINLAIAGDDPPAPKDPCTISTELDER